MKEVKAIIQPFRLFGVMNALHQIQGLTGVTVSEAHGISVERGSHDQVVKTKLEIIVPDTLAGAVVEAIQTHAHTGNPGDGRIFVIPVEESIRIRTGTKDVDQGA